MRARPLLIGALLAAGACAATLAYASRRWNATSRALLARLGETNELRRATYSRDELAGLPAPVQRYLAQVLTDGQPLITHARIGSSGTFNMGDVDAPAWKRFTAEQDFYPGAPGFVWDARVRMAPGIDAFVRDAFVDGRGSMHGAVLGILTVVDSGGTPEMAAGSLLRYLAEAPWLPTALLPSQGIVWTPLTETSARATLCAGKTTVSLDYHFGDDGLLTFVEGMRDNDKLHAKHLWGGTYSKYVARDGMRIPTESEVYWRLPAGYLPYWRGTVTPAYDFASPQAMPAHAKRDEAEPPANATR